MPSLPDGTPPEIPPAVPPIIDPARFEDFPAFRETFLLVFTEPEHNAALRVVGNLLFEMALEFRRYWPDQPEGSLRSELRAAVADLRFIQGHLASLGDEEVTSPATPVEEHHARVAARLALTVREVADALEVELGPWRGETV
jgi:hypothetical protein